jgi:hypothetical protein
MTEKFLSQNDIRVLTGACTRQKQKQMLGANRVVFFVNARGWPVVPVTALAGPSQVASKPASPQWRPDVNAITNGTKKN